MDKVEIIRKYQLNCQQIVEKYIEPVEFDSKQLLADLHYITRSHYDDIVDERNCSEFCGYVCCASLLTKDVYKPQQKYHIKNNKIYNVERRRKFCSDLCFKSSDFLRDQICVDPVFLRPQKLPPLNLYSKAQGSSGDEVKLDKPRPKIAQTNPDKQYSTAAITRQEKTIEQKMSSPYIKEVVFDEIKLQFSSLTIKEKNVIEPEELDEIIERQRLKK